MNSRRLAIEAVWAAACFCGACAQTPSQLRVQLESFDPADRVRAAVTIAERGDDSQLGALVDRLDDEDPAVRFYVILALEQMTNTRLGYSYAAPIADRRRAIETWRRYVRDRATAAESTE